MLRTGLLRFRTIPRLAVLRRSESNSAQEQQLVEEKLGVLLDPLAEKNKIDNYAKRFLTESARHTAPDEEISWDDAMAVIEMSEEVFPEARPSPDQLLAIRATRPTQTLAALVNESRTLQKLVDLGVSLHTWEQNNHVNLAVKLDFVRDVAPVVRFLADVGIRHDRIGDVLTENPLLIEEEVGRLKTRVAYMGSKNFTEKSISKIITECPSWLNYPVKVIDSRLGFLQKSFGLTGDEVRKVAAAEPNLVVWKGTPRQVHRLQLCVTNEMGFTKTQSKNMLVNLPKLYKSEDEEVLFSQFSLLHNTLQIPHHIMSKFPESLLSDTYQTEHRHEFLESLGRAQYDPSRPNYVSPASLTQASDLEFCQQVAKCPVKLYNQFLKTL
jgi:mTERF domain-containing protein